MNTPKLDLSGLSAFSNLVQQPPAAAKGKPLVLPLDAIEEDPDQPRREFDPEALQELADSISAKGVKSPISVRPHPTAADRYIINHGARRWRASKLAGKTEIPVFIDENHDDIDQLAENIQRENLSTREIVDAIAKMLASNKKQADIARELGKSKTWVSKHVALTNLPAPLAELLATGRCKDASTLYEALQCWKADEAAVTTFLANLPEDKQVVQADIEALRASIMRRQAQPAEDAAAIPSAVADAPSTTDTVEPAVITPEANVANDDDATEHGDTTVLADPVTTVPVDPVSSRTSDGAGEGDDQRSEQGGDEDGERRQNLKPQSKGEPDPTKVRKPVVQVRVGRREAVLLVNRKAAYGLAWVEYEDGSVDELDIAKIKLVAITDAAK